MKINDVVRVARRMKSGYDFFTCRLTGVASGFEPVRERVLLGFEESKQGKPGIWFSYEPCSRVDSVHCIAGAGFLADTPGIWGVQSVEVIGTELPPPRPFSPQPGDRHYDLMC